MADTQEQLKKLYATIAKWVEIYRANGGRRNPDFKEKVAYFEEIKSTLLPAVQQAMKANPKTTAKREQGSGGKKVDATQANQSILDIRTNGSKSRTLYPPYRGVEASEKAADLHKRAVVRQKENLVNAGEKYGVPPAVLGAIMSRETGGGSQLKSLKQFGMNKNSMAARIREYITKRGSAENKVKYANLRASDLPGLDDNEKIWGDHAYGYGLMQFDVRWHPEKIIEFLGHRDPVARANAVIEKSAKLMADNMADVRRNRPNWSDDEVLMTALAMYNGGADYRERGHAGYMPGNFDLSKVDESTTGDDYAQDTIARAKKYARSGDFDGDGSGGGTTTDPTTGTPPVVSSSLTGSVGKGGDNKEGDVLLVQKRLNAHGASLTEDGKYGNNTLAAIEAFQQKTFGWKDGLISASGQTAQALMAAPSGGTTTPPNTGTPPVVSSSLTGSVGKGGDNKEGDVLLVQKRLNAHGASLTEDGKYGNNTLEAIEAFQQKTFGWKDGLISASGQTAQALMAAPSGGTTTDPNTGTPPVASSSLTGSVGKGGDNKEGDVLLVQKRLNAHGASLTEDGKYGNNTLAAIEAFQQKTFGWKDGLISASGQTAQALMAAPSNDTPNPTPIDDDGDTGGGSGYFSHPRANEVRLSRGSNAIALTSKAEALLRSLLAASGNFSATVTSTLRTLYHQARVMHENYPARGALINLYGSKARAVEAARDAVKARGGSKAQIIQAMMVPIDAHNKANPNRLFSKHMSNRAIDISPSSLSNIRALYREIDRQIPISGTGVSKLIEVGEGGEKAVHVEFTFDVTSGS